MPRRPYTVADLWAYFLSHGSTFDDRREYSVEDFMNIYGLSEEDAKRLYKKFRQYEQTGGDK